MNPKAIKPARRRSRPVGKVDSKASTQPHTQSEQKTGVNRSISAGDHRGDRRDMSPTYSGNTKHASRGNLARKDVSTRKR